MKRTRRVAERKVMKRLLFALFFVVVGCDGMTRPANTVDPEAAANAWADKLKIPHKGAACTQVDSDGDGYVSCVLAIDTGDQPPRYQGLQCAELGSTKSGGCKPDPSITLPQY
jgi:hypothetical protein